MLAFAARPRRCGRARRFAAGLRVLAALTRAPCAWLPCRGAVVLGVVTALTGHGCAWRAQQSSSMAISARRKARRDAAGPAVLGTSGYATLAKVNVPQRGSALFRAVRCGCGRQPEASARHAAPRSLSGRGHRSFAASLRRCINRTLAAARRPRPLHPHPPSSALGVAASLSAALRSQRLAMPRARRTLIPANPTPRHQRPSHPHQDCSPGPPSRFRPRPLPTAPCPRTSAPRLCFARPFITGR